jgi:hypothetical protein
LCQKWGQVHASVRDLVCAPACRLRIRPNEQARQTVQALELRSQSSSLAPQEQCARAAQAEFVRDWGSDPKNAYHFTDHYNPILNRCFIEAYAYGGSASLHSYILLAMCSSIGNSLISPLPLDLAKSPCHATSPRFQDRKYIVVLRRNLIPWFSSTFDRIGRPQLARSARTFGVTPFVASCDWDLNSIAAGRRVPPQLSA